MLTAEAIGQKMLGKGRDAVIACLKAVAQADGEIAAREAALIETIEKTMTVAATEAATAASSPERG